MRIRTRLFLGIASLMSALLLVQYLLYARQVDALNQELNLLSMSVGRSLLEEALPDIQVRASVASPAPPTAPVPPRVRAPDTQSRVEVHSGTHAEAHDSDEDSTHPTAPAAGQAGSTVSVSSAGSTVSVSSEGSASSSASGSAAGAESSSSMAMVSNTNRRVVIVHRDVEEKDGAQATTDFELQVLDDENGRRMTVRGLPGGERLIQIPTEGATDVVRETGERSLLASSLLLGVSLLLAAIFSHRMSQPLQALVQGAEVIGRGDLSHRLTETGPGELGELQRAFNRMADQLTRLESERQRWQSREHLAELGELARGLAHTLRNPMNTLGLAVEELARTPQADAGESLTEPDAQSRQELATVARTQLQRIDRWLRSFLAVGAGNAATPESLELNALLEGLALEFLQQHRDILLELPETRVHILGVPLALRAALSNLLDNAVAASPPDQPAELVLTVTGGQAQITIRDHGPGIPEQVREHLFSPHTTTRPGGSGMGLFLSRQILVTGHNGQLSLQDGPSGGTEARVTLPLLPDPNPAQDLTHGA